MPVTGLARRSTSVPAPSVSTSGVARRSQIKPPGAKAKARPKSAHVTSNSSSMLPNGNPSSATTEEQDMRKPTKKDYGCRVLISGVKQGVLRYCGTTHIAQGKGEFCGVELDVAEGKNNGTIEGVQYFVCQENHGIFAPIDRVAVLDGCDPNGNISNRSRDSSPPVAHVKGKQISGSVQRSARSVLPGGPNDSGSKLVKPRAIVKPLSSQVEDVKVSPKHKSQLPSPSSPGNKKSKLKSPGVTSVKSPVQLRMNKRTDRASKLARRSDPTGAGQKLLHQTFNLPSQGNNIDSSDQAISDAMSNDLEHVAASDDLVSRVAPKDAMVLTYTVDEDEEHEGQNQASHRLMHKKSISKSKSAHGHIAPGSMLWTDTKGRQRMEAEPSDSGGEAMSESEAEEDDLDPGMLTAHDPMTLSQMSTASSIPLLTESMIMSAFTMDLANPLTPAGGAHKDLDAEPDDDMTSSTISGNDLDFKLEQQKYQTMKDMTFDPDSQAKTSTPTLPDEVCSTPVFNLMENVKGNDQLITAGNSPVVAGAGIFDPPDDPTQAAKVQLATAAVSQYADLVRQSSVERDKMSRSSSTNSVNVPGYKTNKTFVVGAGYEDGASASSNDLQEIIQREAEKLCAEIQADAISEELVSPVDCPNKLQFSTSESQQLLADLTAGHHKQQRPLSVLSTDSADTGIADILGPPRCGLGPLEERRTCPRERPISTVSTCSADTGIVSDYGRPLSMISTASSSQGDDHVMVSDEFSSTADTPVTSVTSEDPVTSDVTSQGPSPPVSLDSSIDETDKTLSLLPQDSPCDGTFLQFPSNPLDPVLDTQNEDWDMEVTGTSSEGEKDISLDEEQIRQFDNKPDLLNMLAPEISSVTEDNVNSSGPSETSTMDVTEQSGASDNTESTLMQESSDDMMMDLTSMTSSILISSTVDRLMSCSTISEGFEDSTPSTDDSKSCCVLEQSVENLMDSSVCLEDKVVPEPTIVVENKVDLCYQEVLQPQMDVRQKVDARSLENVSKCVDSVADNVMDVTKDVTDVSQSNATQEITDSSSTVTKMELSEDVKTDVEMEATVAPPVIENVMSESVCKDEGPEDKDKCKMVDVEVVSGNEKQASVPDEVVIKDGASDHVQFVVGTESDDASSETGKSSKVKKTVKKDLDKTKKSLVKTAKPSMAKTEKSSSTKTDTVQKRNKLNEKISKNVANRRKASIVDGNLHGIEISTESTKGLKGPLGRRASMPPKFEPPSSMKTITARPVTTDNKKLDANKKITRPAAADNLNKSKTMKNKYDNVQSRIGVTKPAIAKSTNSNKSIENKLKPNTSKVTAQAKTTENLSRKSTSAAKSTGIVNRRASIATIPTASRLPAGTMSSRASTTSLKAQQQKSGQSSLSNSRVSSASDLSSTNAKSTTVKKSAASAKSTLKPPGGTTAARKRSPSAGSEILNRRQSQKTLSELSSLSVFSICSSQTSSGQPSSASSMQRNSSASTLAQKTPNVNTAAMKRRSIVGTLPTVNPRTATAKPEMRRASLASASVSRVASKSVAASQSIKPAGKDKPGVKTTTTKRPATTKDNATKQSTEEITRLEALCESRTKELNYARMQLKQGEAGFQAMTVLVQYLSHELDAFSCPDIKAKLASVQQQFNEAQDKLATLQSDKQSIEEELSVTISKHQTETQQLTEKHQQLLTEERVKLETQQQEKIRLVTETHEQEVVTMKNENEEKITDLQDRHRLDTDQLESLHNENVELINRQHELAQTELQQQHQSNLQDFTNRFESIKRQLIEKIESLREECAELHRRESTHAEQCQRDAELRVQQAMAAYLHLPDEIESLKAVLDMKNQEVRELRMQHMEHTKQMEELPRCREKIKSLEQKNENLQAIIDLKADYEKELSGKHQQLIRRCDREQKQNKRLSMNMEEIMYRMTQSEHGTDYSASAAPLPALGVPPGALPGYHRQLSRSPPITPDAARKKRSPLPNGGSISPLPRSPRLSEGGSSPRGSSFFPIVSPRSPREKKLAPLEDIAKKQNTTGSNVTMRKKKKPNHIDIEPSAVSPSTPEKNGVNVPPSEHVHSLPTSPEKAVGSSAGMKRSGTYDLLDQDFSVEDDSLNKSMTDDDIRETPLENDVK